MVFKSIVQPYCAQVWGSLGRTSNKLQRLQNRAVRIISRQGYNVRSDEILKSFGFLNLQQQRILQLLILMYKIDKKLAPKYLIEIFTNINQIHDHDIRQSQCNLARPKPNTDFMKKTFGYRGSLVWNNLSVDVKSSETLNIFKNKIKKLDI